MVIEYAVALTSLLVVHLHPALAVLPVTQITMYSVVMVRQEAALILLEYSSSAQMEILSVEIHRVANLV